MADLADLRTALVFTGTTMMKAGLCVDDAPREVFPCIVGKPKHKHLMAHMGSPKDAYVGDEAIAKSGLLTLDTPARGGIIRNWDDMVKVWEHTFNALGFDSERQPVLLSDAPHNPKNNRGMMSEIMFETFYVPAMSVATQPLLSLYGNCVLTGVVVYSGGGVTHIVPFYDGHAMQHAIQRLDIGGGDLTKLLAKQLVESGYIFESFTEHEIVRDIKQKVCYVALDYERELNDDSVEKNYELPDGEELTIGGQRFRCPEALFQPSLMGLNEAVDGLHTLIYNSIMMCDVEIREHLFGNIILSGGSTMFRGFAQRLDKEITALAPSSCRNKVKVVALPERRCTVPG